MTPFVGQKASVTAADRDDAPSGGQGRSESGWRPPEERTHGEWREPIESIIVAFILAFVFRAFVVEAFIIPTGSMAPTLYGEHGSITCADCGYGFAYGVRGSSGGGPPIHRMARVFCPNCGHVNTNLKYNDDDLFTEAGDRILVLKWTYDLHGGELAPQRWDVVVFKDPKDGETNFIKRMVGLPGEVLSILDGDFYRVPFAELSSPTQKALEAFAARKAELQFDPRRGESLEPLPEAVKQELDEKLRISRKTPVAQKSLWLPVYNHDFPPRGLDGGQPRWEAVADSGKGWEVAPGRLSFSMEAGGGFRAVELVNANLFDDYAYNVVQNYTVSERMPVDGQAVLNRTRSSKATYGVSEFISSIGRENNYVDDLRVEAVVIPKGEMGEFGFRLTKLDRQLFGMVRYENGRATVSLFGGPLDGTPENGRAALLQQKSDMAWPAPGLGVPMAFEVVDYRAAFEVGDVRIETTDDQLGPRVGLLRRGVRKIYAPPRLLGSTGSQDFLHVRVQRDIYYQRSPASDHVRPGISLPDLGCWADAENPILLRQGEYFCCGDNSPASEDSRLWIQFGPHLWDRDPPYQLGTVPEDQLIGSAFFVYWPSGHRLGRLRIIPNVGEMRWIR